MAEKLIYYFSKNRCDGDASMRNLLGAKGANLAEMCKLGIPVPPGFTIATTACNIYHKNNDLSHQIYEEYITLLENEVDRKFGDVNRPLLVSVRSGSVDSMPGMLDTILNVGLNDQTVVGLIKYNDERFAYDSYCRFIQMYASVVLKIDHFLFDEIIENEKLESNVENYLDLNSKSLQKIITHFKYIIYENTGSHFPQDVHKQLHASIAAVFDSWKNDRAITYRQIHNISDELGTAVNIQSMVFGNMNNNSATGVVFTRNPSTGEKNYFGEFLIKAQGEDIVAGTATPWQINGLSDETMENLMPEIYQELCTICSKLEMHYHDMQDIEFTVQEGRLWILQTRSGKRTAEAAVHIAADMVDENLITKEEAILKIDPYTFNKLLHPVIDTNSQYKVIAKGLPASPGVTCGQVAFTSEDAKQMSKQGKKAILVRLETNPEDIEGMNVACGIVTARGGMTSHAAVVARGMGRPCVCGVSGIYIDKDNGFFSIGSNIKIFKGDFITINGSNGEIILGTVPTIQPQSSKVFKTIMSWADEVRVLGVRANADTPEDAKIAQNFNADGIGLCRTEHMFFSTERISIVQRLITAEDNIELENALNELEAIQKKDFKEIFTIMQGKPITIRLLDPPLHEFLPHNDTAIEEIAKSSWRSAAAIKNKVCELSEKNPMLGHRGCRLAISHPKIYEMQTRAIFSAAQELKNEKDIKVVPEIMIPFVMDEIEFSIICSMVKDISLNFNIDYLIGTMIELPRAALIADKIAKHADFFSFGTNDLTQTTMGLSRDDSTKFLNHYMEKKIFKNDPFEVLDFVGVGELIKIAVDKGRKAAPKIKLGICGEHGGDPESIKFFTQIGLDYVSCSPFRVPIAKLTAAQCAILKKQR